MSKISKSFKEISLNTPDKQDIKAAIEWVKEIPDEVSDIYAYIEKEPHDCCKHLLILSQSELKDKNMARKALENPHVFLSLLNYNQSPYMVEIMGNMKNWTRGILFGGDGDNARNLIMLGQNGDFTKSVAKLEDSSDRTNVLCILGVMEAFGIKNQEEELLELFKMIDGLGLDDFREVSDVIEKSENKDLNEAFNSFLRKGSSLLPAPEQS